jgi:hypothetical protein
MDESADRASLLKAQRSALSRRKVKGNDNHFFVAIS